MARLNQRFFRRPPEEVAPRLVGCELRTRDGLRLRVTEVEAYGGPEDSASHARFAQRTRNQTMFGPPGRAYIYLCYGIHWMFNVVAHGPRGAGAVLVRSCAVVSGHEVVVARRRRPAGEARDPRLVAGPGKVGQVLAVTAAHDGLPLYRSGFVEIHAGKDSLPLRCGPRVGIDFARPRDRDLPWRFATGEGAHVSHPRGLRLHGH